MRYDITTFGARPDATTINTAAIQNAIHTCANAGGGEVFVPPGRFLTGTLRLRSGVTLHVGAGATLLGSANITDYPADVHKNMYANEAHMDRCLIFADGARGIGVIGRGAIDGQGASFPTPADPLGQRPMLVRLVNCEDILLRDVHLANPASWTAAVLYCSRICADNVRIHSRANQNGDGLIFDGCHDVRVSNSSFDTSDNSICLQASRSDRRCENITITNCTMSSQWAGIRVGLLSSGVIRDVVVDNCVFRDIVDVALKIQVNEGGIVENLRFCNLVMRETPKLALITLNRHRVGVETPPGVPPMGALRNIHIGGVRLQTIHSDDRKPAIILAGSPDGKLESVSIEDANITIPGGGEPWTGRLTDVREFGTGRPEHRALGGSLPAYGLYARHVRGLRLRDVRFHLENEDPRPPQVLDDVTVDG